MTTQPTTYDERLAFAIQGWRQLKLRLPTLEFDVEAWKLALRAVELLPYEQLGLLIARDPDPEQHCFRPGFAREWLKEGKNSTEVLQRLATMALVSLLPVFEHHCSDCRYLGKMKLRADCDYFMDRNVRGGWVDLYTCTVHGRPVVKVRYHDNPECCYTGSLDTRNDVDPHLQEAWRRLEEP